MRLRAERGIADDVEVRLYPNGLANSSGHLGHEFIPHMTGGVQCFSTKLIGKPSANDEGFLDHAYIPSFMHTKKRDYHGVSACSSIIRTVEGSDGRGRCRASAKQYKQSIKDRYPAFLTFSPYGEKTPDEKSYIDLDPVNKDAWGLPIARRHVYWNDNDMAIFRDMQRWSKDILVSSERRYWTSPQNPEPITRSAAAAWGTIPRHRL